MLLNQQQRFQHQYLIEIISIKMKIKFNCKIMIQYQDKPIISQIEAKPTDFFITPISRIVTLQENNHENCFTFSISLVTNKGNKYLAGSVILYYSQLQQIQKNNRHTFNISKCIDPDAALQIKIIQTKRLGIIKEQDRFKENSKNSFVYSPRNNVRSNKFQINKLIQNRMNSQHAYQLKQTFGPESQAKFSLSNINHMKLYQNNNAGKSRSRNKDYIQRSQAYSQYDINRQKNRSPTSRMDNSGGKKIVSKMKSSRLWGPNQDQLMRDNQVPSQAVLRKLQDKLKQSAQTAQKQFEKRLALEDAEGGYKLEILRLKLKSEENQKIAFQKNEEIKQLKRKIRQLETQCQQNQLKIGKSIENVKYQSVIDSLQQQIYQINQQLEELRGKNSKAMKSLSEKQFLYKKEIALIQEQLKKVQDDKQNKQSNLLKANKQVQNYRSLLENKDSIIRNLEEEITRTLGNNIMQKDQKIRILQSSKIQLQKTIELLTHKIAVLETEKIKRIEENQSSKNKISTVEYNYTLLMKTNNSLQQQLAQIPRLKQKINLYDLNAKKIQNEKKLAQNGLENLRKNYESAMKNLEQKLRADNLVSEKAMRSLQSQNSTLKSQIKDLQNKIQYSLNNQLSNLKKNNEKLKFQSENAKNTERNTSKQLRNAQIKISSLNGQLQALKSKYSGSQNMLKLESQRLHSQNRNMKQQLQKQIMRGLQLKQKNQQLGGQNLLLSSKISHLTESSDRLRKQLQNKLENHLKTIKSLQQKIEHQNMVNMEISEKQKLYMNKIKEYDLNENQYVGYLTKYENDINNLTKQNQALRSKIQSRTNQLQKLKGSQQNLNLQFQEVSSKFKNLLQTNKENQTRKNSLQKQKNELQFELKILKQTINNKQAIIQKLKYTNQLETKAKSNFKDDLQKLQNKAESIKKEHSLFKEHLYDVISRELGNMEGLDINLYIFDSDKKNESRVTIRDNQEYLEGLQTKRTHGLPQKNHEGPDQNQIINAIKIFSKETKAIINTLKEQIKESGKELEGLKHEFYQNNAQLTQQIKYKKEKIYELERKNQQIQNFLHLTKKELTLENQMFNRELKDVKKELESTLNKNQQLIFNLNGLQMAKEADREFYDISLKESKDAIFNLESNYENIYEQNTALQIQKSQLGLQLKFSNQELNKLRTEIKKKSQKIESLQSQISMKQKLITQIKVKNKELVHRISQIQLFLSAQKQLNQNNKKALSQEEKKLMQAKDFLNNLIKQKQTILKEQITMKQQCLELESMNSQLNSKIQSLEQGNKKMSKDLHNQKQINKKMGLSIKNLEAQIQSFQDKHRRAIDKSKQKQRELALRVQSFKAWEHSMQGELDKKSKELKQKEEEIQILKSFHQQQRRAMEKQSGKTEDELFKIKQQLKYSLFASENSASQLQKLRKSYQQNISEIQNLKNVTKNLEDSKSDLQRNYNNLLQQIKQKDERLYEMAGEINAIENLYHDKLASAKREIEDLQENMSYKYEAMCEDYEAKIEQLEKQRDYLNGKIQIIEGECKKIEEKLHLQEYEDNELRMKSQNKLIKTEQQKNTMIYNLRTEIKKINQGKSEIQDKYLKLSIQFQSIKNLNKNIQAASLRLEQKNKEHQNKNQSLRAQINNLQHSIRQASLQLKQYQEMVSNYQWSLERQLKKQFQNISRYIIQCFNQNQEKLRKDTINMLHISEQKIIKIINTNINGSPKRQKHDL